MPTVTDVFPDAEAAASVHLRAQTLSYGTRVYSEIPKEPEYPLVKVARVGGMPTQPTMRLDNADLQFDVYGISKSQARLAVAQVQAAMKLAEGTAVVISSGNAFITGVDTISGPSWIPDASNTVTHRYILSMRVYLHAA